MTECVPDSVMLADFEHLLEMGEATVEDSIACDAVLLELCQFMDANGRRLLLLARTCEQALSRQTKGPPA
jgi:hypothetical protein